MQNAVRVHFFDKQFLRTQDLADEQLYHLLLLRRHDISLHSWGIVSGLELTIESGPVVQPGIAIDGYGRELLLQGKQQLPTTRFNDLATNSLDVWLIYGRSETEAAPSGYACPGSSNNSYRSNETPQILLEKPLSNTVDSRHPPGVPASILASPVPVTSDDPSSVWRVYLGRVTRTPTQPDSPYTVDLSQRPYAGVVGELIDHPENATRVEVGRTSDIDDSRTIDGITYVYSGTPNRRFAVFVPGAQEQQPEQVTLVPRLEIKQDGTIYARGDTTINGSLRLAGGAVQFKEPANFTADDAPQVASLYRTQKGANDELRVDLGADDPLGKRFVIGFSNDDGSFTPCLRLELKDNGNKNPSPLLTIYGDMTIQGKLDSPDIKARTLSPEAQNAILGSFQSGVAAGGAGT
jgi:hypothetical protein